MKNLPVNKMKNIRIRKVKYNKKEKKTKKNIRIIVKRI